MKVQIEQFDKIKALLPGLFQFEKNGFFSQAELAITEEELLIYDDHSPDTIEGDVYGYKIKVRYPLSSVNILANEKIIKNNDLREYGRLNISFKEGESAYFYYYVSDHNKLSNFINAAISLNVKIKNRRVDFAPLAR